MQFETQEFDWSGRRRFRRLNLDSPLWWTNDPSSPSSTSFVGGCCVKMQSPSAIEPTRCTVAAESTLVFSMDWAQVSTRMQRSRKPALCTFRALPSIHPHSEPRHVPTTPILASVTLHRISGAPCTPLLNSLYRFLRRACRSILHSCDSTGTHLVRRTSGPCWLQRTFPIPPSGCDSLTTLVLLAPFNYLMQGTPAPIETGEAPPFANTAAANARVVFSN